MMTMNATSIEPTRPPVRLAATKHGIAPQPLRAFVAFDEDDCARNAKVLIHCVTKDELCYTELCRLRSLASLPQANAVARTASATDLLILALRGGNNLAQPERNWLSRMLALRESDQEGALVVLLSGANAQPSANAELLDYLETLAVLSRMIFFAGHTESMVAASTGFVAPHATNFTPFTATMRAPDPRHRWGINK